jgi:hypothetical protein
MFFQTIKKEKNPIAIEEELIDFGETLTPVF